MEKDKKLSVSLDDIQTWMTWFQLANVDIPRPLIENHQSHQHTPSSRCVGFLRPYKMHMTWDDTQYKSAHNCSIGLNWNSILENRLPVYISFFQQKHTHADTHIGLGRLGWNNYFFTQCSSQLLRGEIRYLASTTLAQVELVGCPSEETSQNKPMWTNSIVYANLWQHHSQPPNQPPRGCRGRDRGKCEVHTRRKEK